MPRKKTPEPVIDRRRIVPRAKPRPKAPFVKLWRFLTIAMRERLTKLAGTTPNTMRQYVSGRRSITPDIAIRVEKATYRLGVDPLNRMQLSDTCNKCEYARLVCGETTPAQIMSYVDLIRTRNKSLPARKALAAKNAAKRKAEA